jgi:hypothetical protein
MWSSKDIGLVALLAALGFVSVALIVQTGYLLTGIPGTNSLFTVVLAIQTGFAMLAYQGRRWRFFVQIIIFTILIIPLNYGSPSFDILGKSVFIIAGFFTDLIGNSLYGLFNRKDLCKYWAIINGGLIFWSIQTVSSMVISTIFYFSQAAGVIYILTLLSPVMITESIIGSYLGYKIYRRINKEKNIDRSTQSHEL